MLNAGAKLGRYEIQSLIGSGGMGEVDLAHAAGLGRNIALKILLPEAASDEGRMHRFVQEAKATSTFELLALEYLQPFQNRFRDLLMSADLRI